MVCFSLRELNSTKVGMNSWLTGATAMSQDSQLNSTGKRSDSLYRNSTFRLQFSSVLYIYILSFLYNVPVSKIWKWPHELGQQAHFKWTKSAIHFQSLNQAVFSCYHSYSHRLLSAILLPLLYFALCRSDFTGRR